MSSPVSLDESPKVGKRLLRKKKAGHLERAGDAFVEDEDSGKDTDLRALQFKQQMQEDEAVERKMAKRMKDKRKRRASGASNGSSSDAPVANATTKKKRRTSKKKETEEEGGDGSPQKATRKKRENPKFAGERNAMAAFLAKGQSGLASQHGSSTKNSPVNEKAAVDPSAFFGAASPENVAGNSNGAATTGKKAKFSYDSSAGVDFNAGVVQAPPVEEKMKKETSSTPMVDESNEKHVAAGGKNSDIDSIAAFFGAGEKGKSSAKAANAISLGSSSDEGSAPP
ncbi:hypothetical protein FOZ62_006557, partial [Perkinsus olseni]